MYNSLSIVFKTLLTPNQARTARKKTESIDYSILLHIFAKYM